ncbi:hypothetical protein EKG38_17190 [Shewanella canadensis]|uniref:Cytochrome c-552/4 domain-containing protein n=1 Tax=Shewanella canadensis TaxID=271096 RepID=A0A431WRF2_9GAMM|nr:hypothetical protein [Shewanella canadensis]RTR37754.1 hypothetical protein EKG38_17190 [Shewanella canadensis]
MMNLTPVKRSLRILTLAATVAMLAACGSDDNSDTDVVPPVDDNGGSVIVPPVEDSPQALTYVGTDTCLTCHSDKKSFLETNHNFMLNKVLEGKAPDYAFVDRSDMLDLLEGIGNAAGTPATWDDVSYVIGGTKIGMNFIDKHGYRMQGEKSSVFFSNPPIATSEEGTGDIYWCGKCHATGWKDYTYETGDNRNLNRQDDLPGMGGTFAAGGVQCEACHGSGSEHIKSPSKTNITRLATGRSTADLLAEDMAFGKPVACGECHTSYTEGAKMYPKFTSGFNAEFGGDSLNGRVPVLQESQSNDSGRIAGDTLKGLDPDTGIGITKKSNFHCSACHDIHKSPFNKDKPGHENAVKECSECHAGKKFADVGGMSQGAHEFFTECKDCHMPGLNHTFKIDLSHPSDDPYYFGDARDANNKPVWKQPFNSAADSCKKCHPDDYDDRAARVPSIHEK